METMYISGSFVSVSGIILLGLSFYREFHRLTSFQKASIGIVAVGVLVPFVAGLIHGFIQH